MLKCLAVQAIAYLQLARDQSTRSKSGCDFAHSLSLTCLLMCNELVLYELVHGSESSEAGVGNWLIIGLFQSMLTMLTAN